MWFRRTRKTKSHPEAEQALVASHQALEQVLARAPEVHEVAEASRKFRRENHFAADLQNVFGGPRDDT